MAFVSSDSSWVDKILIVIMVVTIGLALFVGGAEYGKTKTKTQKQFDGCWASIKSGEDGGDWVCVNVQDMEWERAVEVCQHEVGHEIFAEICEDNIQGCMDAARGGISREK